VPLQRSAIHTLALAVYEPAANARKYGAPATENGRLPVAWRLRARADRAGIALCARSRDRLHAFEKSLRCTIDLPLFG
jgi:two-component sensor histidine kinase